MSNARVVIVGGGFGGIKTALRLANLPGVAVTLISKTPNFEYHAALYRSATGRSPREVVIPLRDIFAGVRNVQLVLDEITSVNRQQQLVKSATNHEYSFDYLVLAVGQELNYYGIPGMAERSANLHSITATIALRERLRELARTSQQPKVAVVGAGPSGVELAAELRYFLNQLAWRERSPPPNPTIYLVEGSDRPLPLLHPKISRYAARRLQKNGVELVLDRLVKRYEDQNLQLSDGTVLDNIDLVIWTAGNQNNRLLLANHLVETGRAGRAVVDEHLETYPGIYVIGDGADTRYSGMAQTALYDADFVADDIGRQVEGKRRASYKPKEPVYVVPVGRSHAVYQAGRIRLYGFVAWLLRRRADFAIYRQFEPFELAVKTWARGNKMADVFSQDRPKQ